jgi:hypothetical protein
MKKLSETIKHDSYILKLVLRSDKKAIYAKYWGDTLTTYEVIKIKIRPSKYSTFLKAQEPEREKYPSTEQWGNMGWTYRSEEEALEKYNQI